MPRPVSSHVLRRFVTSAVQRKPVTDFAKIGCQESVNKFLDKYDTFMFDCDGVLWKNDHITPIPGTNEAIEKLQALNKRVLYVTNNSIVSRVALHRKFPRHGFHSPIENIFGNAYAASVYLKEFLKVTGKVYLVGGEGMKWELDQIGLENTGIGSDIDKPSADVNDLLNFTFEDNIQAVLVGFDEYFSFSKAYKAATYVRNPECHFVATNNIEKGTNIGDGAKTRRMPLTGMMVDAIGETANKNPVIVGKPNRIMFECILRKHPEIDINRTVFVGDSLKADVGFAKEIQVDSALVLTGVSGIENIHENHRLVPNYVIDCLTDIVL